MSWNPLRSKNAYAGTLGSLPMAIPRTFVCILFAPLGTVQTTASFLNGSKALIIDWSAYGPDSSFPLDSAMFGYVSASGSGTIQYAFLPRDLAQAVRFDTVSPLLKGTLTVNGTVVISGTPSVSISGTPSVTITSGTLNATITNANLTVTNTVSSNGTDTVPAVADTAISTPVSANVLNIIAPAGKRYRVEGIRTSVRNVSSTTFSLSQQTAQLYRAAASGSASTFYNLFNDTTNHTLASNDVWLEWLEYSPPSGSFANYGSGGFGTPIGISGYALPNPIYLYPGDEVSLYVNIPTTGASASVYLQLLGRSEPL